MRHEAMEFERQHYNAMVERYQNEANKKSHALEVKKESLKILQELLNQLDFNPSKTIIREDIKSCEDEINELENDIRYAEHQLKIFSIIAEKVNELK